MAEQAILRGGPADGRVVDIRMTKHGRCPDHLALEFVSAEGGADWVVADWLRPRGPGAEVYLQALWNGSHKPAQDDEGRWYYLWRDPQEHGPSQLYGQTGRE
ncbi:hypothetical protein [Streptomyces huasconensis]|uniref:hypothetical protein n=1 Tax=Streptomyces huasconensis TaxID=1854574 RepID=UPI0033F199D3